MGQAIHYCYRCSTQLRDIQFEQGKAFRIDARVCCSECAPEALRTLPPDDVKQLLAQLATGPQRPATSASAPPVLRTATPRQAVPVARSARSTSTGLWVGVGIAAVAVVLIVAVVLSGGSSGGETVERTSAHQKTPAKAAPPDKPTTSDSPARQALATAQKFAREHPGDLFGQLRQFEDLTLQADKSEAGNEARKQVQAIRSRAKEAIDRALAALDQEISSPISREEFGAAYDLLEAAKARMEWPEWKLAVDEKTSKVRKKLDALYEPLKTQAAEAKGKGDGPALNSIVARVRGWGVPRLVDDLADSLAGVALPPVRLPLQDFEGDPKGWGYVGGWEFKGAKGSATLDSTVAHGGRRSYKLEADFSGGGAYVGLWCDLRSQKERDVKEFRLWVKTSTVSSVGIRLADESGQLHQKNGGVALKRTAEWQELVLRVADMVGGEHWGGANDGRWHGPATGFGINVGKGTFIAPGSTQGVIWFDDVEVVVVPSSKDR